MKLIKMVLKNADGKTIEKEVEERLASTYQSIGWKIKEEKPIKEADKFYEPSNRKYEK